MKGDQGDRHGLWAVINVVAVFLIDEPTGYGFL